jgi:uncharacterized membrane protein YeaQ/YmgE (transglycosylase-associated protein family)
MIGMDFVSFIILLAISVVVSVVLHFLLKYHVVPGLASFCCKIVIGWIGAWLGSPVFGHWFAGVSYQQVYIIPAILGSLALLVLVVDLVKTCASACGAGAKEPQTPAPAVARPEAPAPQPEAG